MTLFEGNRSLQFSYLIGIATPQLQSDAHVSELYFYLHSLSVSDAVMVVLYVILSYTGCLFVWIYTVEGNRFSPGKKEPFISRQDIYCIYRTVVLVNIRTMNSISH